MRTTHTPSSSSTGATQGRQQSSTETAPASERADFPPPRPHGDGRGLPDYEVYSYGYPPMSGRMFGSGN